MGETDIDIFELLRDEHQDLRELFEEVLDAEPQARIDPFRYLVARLAAHEAAEEALVHRVAQRELADEEVVRRSLDQEADAERKLSAMEDLDPTSDAFVQALRTLQQDVLTHAEHEEREEFPALERELSEQQRLELAQQFQALREIGPTRPHVWTPQNPTVRALTGPIVGLFDRARDAVRSTLDR